MARLRIQVESIVSDGFDLEIPHAHGTASDRVVLASVVKLRGSYEHDARQVRLRRITADALGVAQLAWHWPGGRAVLPTRGDLSGVVLDLAIPKEPRKGARPLTGSITVAEARLGEVGLDLEGARVAGEIAFSALEVHEPADGPVATVALGTFHARGLHASAGEVPVTAGELEAAAVRITREGARLEVHAAQVRGQAIRLRAGGAQILAARFAAADLHLEREGDRVDVVVGAVELHGVEVDTGGAQVRLDHLVLTAGLRWSAGELTLASLEVGAVEVAARLASAVDARPAVPASAPGGGGRRRRRRLDLRFLDHLGGRVDVDASVDARVPFLKRRQATHRFRVPIDHGTLDFKKLEGDLSLLEDSLLDFEVRRGKLVLEVKPPLLRFAKKTLVDWPLEPDQIALAEQDRVHLRTLAAPHVHASADDAGPARAEDAAFELTRLELDPIDAALRLEGPGELALEHGTIHLGTAREPAVGALTVRGAVHHHARGGTAPTELAVNAEAVRIALTSLRVGTSVTSCDALALGAVEDGVVTLEGARPTSARATLRALSLRGLRISPAARRRR